MRSNDQHLDFDMELATSRSNDNPVYYIQYAHARISSVMRQLQERGLAHSTANGLASLGKLTEPQELALIKRVSGFPEVVRQCAAQRAPHTLVHYLRDLANDFHTNYSAHQFIVDDAALRDARLALALATQIVIRNGLELLGVSAPDMM
jgi:arginyl-tRNA synthetase